MLRPFQVAADRIAEPFRDAYAWVDGLFDARSEAEELRKENETLRQQVAQTPARRRARTSVSVTSSPSATGHASPTSYQGLATGVISRPTGTYAQSIVIAAGRNDGLAVDDPVVTQDGLVGTVSRIGSRTARVTLLTGRPERRLGDDPRDGCGRHRPARPGASIAPPARPGRQGGEGSCRRHGRHCRLAVAAPGLDLPEGDHDRAGDERRRRRIRIPTPRCRSRRSPTSGRSRQCSSSCRASEGSGERRPPGRAARLRRSGDPGRDDRRAPYPRGRARSPARHDRRSRARGRIARRCGRWLRGRVARRRDDARHPRDDVDRPDPRRVLGRAVRGDDGARPGVCALSCGIRPHGRGVRRGRRAPRPARPARLGSHRARDGRAERMLAAALVLPLHRLCRRLLAEVVPYERVRRVELV